MYSPFAKFIGKIVGTGQCVDFVKQLTGAPQTALWKRGAMVKGISLLPGTAIATFDPPSEAHPAGKYANDTSGKSHAAVYLSQDATGLQVLDQWSGQPVHHRTIRFQTETDAIHAANNGNSFFVIE